MSRNFELLRRAGKGQALFVHGLPSPVAKQASACLNEEARDELPDEVRNEVCTDQKSHAPSPVRDLGGAAQEEIIKLVRSVFVFPNSHAPRVVSFSSVEGNGSSEICLRAAENLAKDVSGSVCLVDASLHAPSLYKWLRVDRCPGLADALTSSGPIKDYAVWVGPGKLWLLPSGIPGPDVRGLFASDRLGLRIAELRAQFDFVLIDLPPVGSCADAVLLGRMTDGVILVLEANSTRRETARTVKETLESAKVRLLGAILNNRTFPIPDILYRRL